MTSQILSLLLPHVLNNQVHIFQNCHQILEKGHHILTTLCCFTMKAAFVPRVFDSINIALAKSDYLYIEVLSY